MAEFIPSDDLIKTAFTPPDVDTNPHSILYIIQKRFRPTRSGGEQNLYKIGFTRYQRGKGFVRLDDLRTALISFNLYRVYMYEEKDFLTKTGVDQAYAQDKERELHNWVLEHFKFPVTRIPFPGSVEGKASPSEWFRVAKSNAQTFLEGVDNYLQNQSRPPPVLATAFDRTRSGDYMARRLPKKQEIGVGDKVVDGKAIKKETFRATKSKYGNSPEAEEAFQEEQKQKEKREALRKETSAAVRGSVAKWSEVFVGKTFRDKDLGPFTFQFTEVVENIRTLFDETFNPNQVPKQMGVVYKAIKPTGNIGTNKRGKMAAAQGSLSIHEALIAIDAVKAHQKSYDFYKRLNGYNEKIDYALQGGCELEGAGLDDEIFPVKTGAHLCDLSYRMLQTNRTENLLQIKKELTALTPEIGAWDVVAKHSDKNMTTFTKGRALVIAHRGTDTSGRRTSRDVASDAALAIGQQHRNSEFKKRKERTIEIVTAHPLKDIYLCGHSLGGTTVNFALEKAGRVRDKVKFTRTYNAGASPFAPSVSSKIKRQLDPVVRHHRVEGDVVSASFMLKVPFGKVKTIKPTNKTWADYARYVPGLSLAANATRSLDRHALVHFF